MIRCSPTGRVTKPATSSPMNLRVMQLELLPLVLARVKKANGFEFKKIGRGTCGERDS